MFTLTFFSTLFYHAVVLLAFKLWLIFYYSLTCTSLLFSFSWLLELFIVVLTAIQFVMNLNIVEICQERTPTLPDCLELFIWFLYDLDSLLFVLVIIQLDVVVVDLDVGSVRLPENTHLSLMPEPMLSRMTMSLRLVSIIFSCYLPCDKWSSGMNLLWNDITECFSCMFVP